MAALTRFQLLPEDEPVRLGIVVPDQGPWSAELRRLLVSMLSAKSAKTDVRFVLQK